MADDLVLLQITAPICSPGKPADVLFALFKGTRLPVANASVSGAEELAEGDRAKGETDRFEVSEWHELHDVPEDRFALWRAQDSVVPVQNLHVCEVGVAHPHDDDGEGLVGGSDDGLARVRHVRHHAVGEDEQDVVPLEQEKRRQRGRCSLLLRLSPQPKPRITDTK